MLHFPEAKLCPDGRKLCTCGTLTPIPGPSVFQTAADHVLGPSSCVCWRQQETLPGQLLLRAQAQAGACSPWGQQRPTLWAPGYDAFGAEGDAAGAQRKPRGACQGAMQRGQPSFVEVCLQIA